MLNAKEISTGFAKFQFRSGDSARRRIWLKLSTLLLNGAKLIDSLQTLRSRRAKTKGPKDQIVLAMDAWLRQLNNGRKFSEAIGDWVPSSERMLIAAGERSGRLQECLLSCAEVMQSQSKIKKSIIGGLAYPVLLVFASFGVLFFFGYQLVPGFSRAVPADKWTGLAAVMVDMSGWIRSWLWLPFVMMLITSGVLMWSLPNWISDFRNKVENYPPFSIYRIVNGSTWIISLSAMVSAGERLEDALKMIAKNNSKWMTSRTNAIMKGLRSGSSLGDAMAKSGTGFPDPEIIDDLMVYSQVSGLDESLKKIAQEWMTESVDSIQSNMAIVFNLGIIVTAVLIGFMVSGLIAMNMQLGTILQQGLR